MARNFKQKEKLDAISELNVTPLIDLAFSLLIIFMITTPLMEQSIRVNVPFQTAGISSSDEPDVEVIAIDASGDVHWGTRKVDEEELRNLLQQAANEPEQPVIHLKADRDLDYQSVIDVIALIAEYKLSKLNIDTQPK